MLRTNRASRAGAVRSLLLAWRICAPALLLAAGCSGSSSHQAATVQGSGESGYQDSVGQQLVGVWADADGVEFTFEMIDGDLELTRVVDWDGEEFLVQASDWEGTDYVFTYFVPSTEYVVTFRLEEIAPEEIYLTWSNASPDGVHGEGSDVLVRVE